ncbi:type II toxin-antitoxin system VapB family antitoxin [Belliella sp. R4-6]|uniref:Type II toxin-antitoxin system VapB family antitoxin n=2 Tax=Belliella TaxID=232244 RepID=A0ABS9UJ65_9BACT|nr:MULTISPECIES: type II toxin-antitoxin system VapB family antitoxin [Belliella]MCH7396659.1 type II toxin-antitoxin system VapB family antitoxin [Belliella calami]MCH7415000.1 type II toxin-antitoxin system VapB family antitoxin [Belliella alkalica]
MKVTAIIPDDLIAEAMELSKSGTVTDTLKIALITYIRSQKLKELGTMVFNEPLEFKYSSQELRDLNRK